MINSLLFAILLATGCTNSSKQTQNTIALKPDTIRPSSVSKQATLINYGGDDMPVYVWVEYAGPLINNGKKYAHIHGIKFSYIKPKKTYTEYYENLDIRNASRKFDFNSGKVQGLPGDANIGLVSGIDSLLLFRVLGNYEFTREFRGMTFSDVSTISLNQYGEYVADINIEFNLKKNGNGAYTLTFYDGSTIQYKATSGCKVTNESISFLNRENGRIYLLDRTCYLELVNKKDVKRFQELR